MKRSPDSTMSSLTKATSSKFSGRSPAISEPLVPSGTRSRSSGGMVSSAIGSFTVSPSTSAGKKFIAGLPMNPATNRLAGRV